MMLVSRVVGCLFASLLASFTRYKPQHSHNQISDGYFFNSTRKKESTEPTLSDATLAPMADRASAWDAASSATTFSWWAARLPYFSHMTFKSASVYP